jgi:ubiquinone/menaquinone biosynthesis C-methylase UbiE
MNDHEKNGPEEEEVSASTTAVSFKQYGGNAAENYERYFVPAIGTPFATTLLDAAGLHRGERVLDVACGTGVVTRLAAERVGPDSAVGGLDINPAMLAVARSVSSSGAPIEWHEASAESLPLADGSFDVVLSSLGLQFVSDKLSALGEMRRVLAPHGRLAIATVGPTPQPFTILEQALARYVKPEAAAFMRVVFSLHEPQELEKLASDAGFTDVEVRSEALTLKLPRTRRFSLAVRPQHPFGGGRRSDRRRRSRRIAARRHERIGAVRKRWGLGLRSGRRPDDRAEVI